MLRLNSDTSWLLSVPHPLSHPNPTGRSHFNILIDPWLSGNHVDIVSWFSTQWHNSPAHWPTTAEIDQLLFQCEANANVISSVQSHPGSPLKSGEIGRIDLVIVSDSMTDHCHYETMIQVSRCVPIFASQNAASIIRGWSHFTTVNEIPLATRTPERQTELNAVLPPWLTLLYVSPPFYDPIHGAVVICLEGPANTEAEAIYYIPHGIEKADLALVKTSYPNLKPLALLHGLDKVRFAGFLTANMGVENAVSIQQNLQAKYWFDTHDEQTDSTGFARYLLTREHYTVGDGRANRTSRLESLGFKHVASGDAFLL